MSSSNAQSNYDKEDKDLDGSFKSLKMVIFYPETRNYWQTEPQQSADDYHTWRRVLPKTPQSSSPPSPNSSTAAELDFQSSSEMLQQFLQYERPPGKGKSQTSAQPGGQSPQ